MSKCNRSWLVFLILCCWSYGWRDAAAQPTSPKEVSEDALSYSLAHEVDPVVALERFRLEELAGHLEEELTTHEAATFGGLWIEHQPRFRVVVALVGDSAATLAPYISGTPLSPVVEVRSVTATYAQLQTAQQLALRAADRLRRTVNAGIDLRRNLVELYTLDRESLLSSFAAAHLYLPPYVDLIEVAALSVDDDDIYAGLPLTSCTNGWSVKNSTGTKGIVTSEHCGNSQSYDGVSLPFKAQAHSGSCDVQWHSDSRHVAVPEFIADDPSDTRLIHATKSRSRQVVGGYVCKHGKTTGYTCGYISDKNFSPGSLNDAPTYIRVHRDGVQLSDGGDSGGPWFKDNTGYGVHKCSIGDDACYMAIDYVASCLSLTVLLD